MKIHDDYVFFIIACPALAYFFFASPKEKYQKKRAVFCQRLRRQKKAIRGYRTALINLVALVLALSGNSIGLYQSYQLIKTLGIVNPPRRTQKGAIICPAFISCMSK